MKDKKEIITEVAFLLALKKGFNNVSMKEIQKASGVSAGTIYYYFKDKDEILLHMVNFYLLDNFHQYREVIRNSNESFIEKIEDIFYYLIGFNKKEFKSSQFSSDSKMDDREYFGLFSSIFHQYPESRPLFYKLHEESFDFYLELAEEAVENNEIKEGIDARTLAIFIHTIFKGYLDLFVFKPDLSIEDLVNSNLKIIEEMTKK